jgi:hypothetical protein
MSPSNVVVPWKAQSSLVGLDQTSDVPEIVGAARQLRKKEAQQLALNMEAGHYELAASYVWHKTMSLLKKQLATLGNQFISELLQRPDIDEHADIRSLISDSEAISLAKDLGAITQTQALRLIHSQQVISHFASVDSEDILDEAEGLTKEEAIGCLRVCVQGVLGQESVGVAEDFAVFRTKLQSQTFTPASPEIAKLQGSPYFFVRTAISVLLSVLRSGRGAQIEHASRNAMLIIPLFWDSLKQPEKWQVGQAYAQEFSDGKKDAIQALHAVLIAVRGFDFVPENLRSTTFVQAANAVITAHQGFNNFYNEPGPMSELASLGTSIPGPAVATCMTAILCVKLGNQYGTSFAAQSPADSMLQAISLERWKYYVEGRLEFDRVILPKLAQLGKPLNRWIDLLDELDLAPAAFSNKTVRELIAGTKAKKPERIANAAMSMLRTALA